MTALMVSEPVLRHALEERTEELRHEIDTLRAEEVELNQQIEADSEELQVEDDRDK